MNNKNRRFKKICLVVVITFLISIVTIFTEHSDTNHNKEFAIDSNIVVDRDVIKQPIAIKPSASIKAPDLIKEIDTIKVPVTTTLSAVTELQEEKVINLKDFLSKDIHQCSIEFDEESVLKINQLIEQLSYEIVLSKSTHQINNYLKLNIISPKLPEHFNEILIYRIQILLAIYRQSFGLNLHKNNDINLVILPSQESYEDFISNLSLDNTNSQGLFWARSNYAFVSFKNEYQAQGTALHEVIHAINFSLVGLQSRWLNEGLAQLFADMKITEENGISTYKLSDPDSKNTLAPMAFGKLINAEGQWGDLDQRSDLYSSSLKFVSYLFNHKEDANIIKNLMEEERKEPCYPLPMERYLEIIDENIFNLPFSFDEWFDVDT